LCARSKHTLVAWATTRAESSGRASAHLAWASLLVFATVRTCAMHPTEVPNNPDIHSNAQSQGIHRPRQYKLKYTSPNGSNFPYLEGK